MQCNACNGSNPDGAAFCMKCGSKLALLCSSCSAEIPAGAAFCMKCGKKVEDGGGKEAASAAALHQYIPAELLAKLQSAKAGGGMQGERRIVTILFCDVKGSTAAAEKLDPEDWHEIMNGAFKHLITPVYRFEGTLARLMGDAILAFFGAPIAHEDDPQRAVMAGLETLDTIRPYKEEVRKKWGIDFDVRVGINTGLVVVGEVGSDLRVEYTAMGDAVNLASRMESTAAPGTVQISENTYRLVAPLFEVSSLGAIEIKGKAAPVQAYRVVRSKEKAGSLRGIQGLTSPLVGREKELKILVDATKELGQGRGSIISLIAEAGLGKSRLSAEWRRRVEDESAASKEAGGHGLRWCEGRSLSYETARPYSPFISMLSECIGLRKGMGDGQRYDLVKEHLAGYTRELLATAPFMAAMLGIMAQGEDAELVRYLEPPVLRMRIHGAMTAYFEAVAAYHPTILLVDDLHWADSASLQLLHDLLHLTDRCALVVATLFRPRHAEPSWEFHEGAAREFPHRYQAVQLQPLDGDHAQELVANLLHVEGLPATMRTQILERAEGNPFFLEEVIRSLIDAGAIVRDGEVWRATKEIDRITIPQNLNALLTTRLDGLDEATRRVAQTASVIGREFDDRVLAAILPAGVDLEAAFRELQRRELVREKSRIPVRTFWFRHGLIQEAAYQSLLLKSRRELHRAVGSALEQDGSTDAPLLARHYLEAQDEPRALPWVIAAGERAVRASSMAEAAAQYEKAADIVERVHDPVLAKRVFDGLFEIRKFQGDGPRALGILERMEAYGKARDEVPFQVSALSKRGLILGFFAGKVEEAQQLLNQAEKMARGKNDLGGLAEMNMIRCFVCSSAGKIEEAEDHLGEAVAIGRQLGAEEPQLFGLVHGANMLILQARFDDARSALERATQFADETGNKLYQSEIEAYLRPFCLMCMGDFAGARAGGEKGVELAARIGSWMNESTGSTVQGMISRLEGDYGRSLTWTERGLRTGQPMGYTRSSALCALGALYADANPAVFAAKVAELHAKTEEALREPNAASNGAILRADMGLCALRGGRLTDAERMAGEALALPTATQTLARPMVWMLEAGLQLAKGDAAGARRLLAEADLYVTERRIRFYEPGVALLSGMAELAAGRPAEALALLSTAESRARELGMRPLLWQALGAQAHVQSALGRASEAAVKAQEASAVVDEMARLIPAGELRTAFLDGAHAKLGGEQSG